MAAAAVEEEACTAVVRAVVADVAAAAGMTAMGAMATVTAATGVAVIRPATAALTAVTGTIATRVAAVLIVVAVAGTVAVRAAALTPEVSYQHRTAALLVAASAPFPVVAANYGRWGCAHLSGPVYLKVTDCLCSLVLLHRWLSPPLRCKQSSPFGSGLCVWLPAL